MPLIEIHMTEGKSPAEKRALLEAVSNAVHESIGTPLSSIRVWIQEFSGSEYIVGGEIFAESRAR